MDDEDRIREQETRWRLIVKDAVHETLSVLGIDMEEPFEAQKDFAQLRAWRKATETVRTAGIKAAVGVLVTGFLGLLWAKLTGKL